MIGRKKGRVYMAVLVLLLAAFSVMVLFGSQNASASGYGSGTQQIIFYDDFSTNPFDNSWESMGEYGWTWDSTHGWVYTNGYHNNECDMFYREVSVKGYTNTVLQYSFWGSSEYGYDYLKVGYADNNGYHIVKEYTGDHTSGWNVDQISLPTNAIAIFFEFYTDDSVTDGNGWWLDWVKIVGTPANTGDSYEPDNDFSDATYVDEIYTYETTQTHTLSPAGDVDYLKFWLESGYKYIFYTTGSTDTVGVLYDSNYNQIAYDDDDGPDYNFQIVISNPSTGFYYLKICGYDSSDTGTYVLHYYKVELGDSYEPDNDFSDANLIYVQTSEETESHNLLPSGDVDFYQFYGEVGYKYIFYTTGSTDTVGVLYDSNYNQIASDDDDGPGSNFKIVYTVTSSGTYYLKIYGWGGMTGDYVLHYYKEQLKIPTPQITEPQTGEVVSLMPVISWSAVSDPLGRPVKYHISVWDLGCGEIGGERYPWYPFLVYSVDTKQTSIQIPKGTLIVGEKYEIDVYATDDRGLESNTKSVVFWTINAPPAPKIDSPSNGATVNAAPTLKIDPVTGYIDPVIYTFRIATDPQMEHIVWSSEPSTATEVEVPSGILKPNAIYYWDVGAANEYDALPLWSYSGVHHFTTSGHNNPELGITIVCPINKDTICGHAVLIDAVVSSISGISIDKVDFYIVDSNNQKTWIGTDHNGIEDFNGDVDPPYSCYLDTTQYPDGSYTIMAVVTDEYGNTATTTIEVHIDNTHTYIGFNKQWHVPTLSFIPGNQIPDSYGNFGIKLSGFGAGVTATINNYNLFSYSDEWSKGDIDDDGHELSANVHIGATLSAALTADFGDTGDSSKESSSYVAVYFTVEGDNKEVDSASEAAKYFIPQISLNGIKIPAQINRMDIHIPVNIGLSGTITLKMDADGSLDYIFEKDVYDYYEGWDAGPVFGYVQVKILMGVEIQVSGEAHLTALLHGEYDESGPIEISYVNGHWTFTPSLNPPSTRNFWWAIDGGASLDIKVKPFIVPQVFVAIYGIAGPVIQLGPEINAEAHCTVDTSGHIAADYYVYGGYRAKLGLGVSLIDPDGKKHPWKGENDELIKLWEAHTTIHGYWVDDSLPYGAEEKTTNDHWTWVSTLQGYDIYSGSKAHKSDDYAGIHQHYFYGAQDKLTIPKGSYLVQWIYIPSGSVPREIMLQWHCTDGSGWGHRAYWGENLIPWGTDGTPSRFYMGDIPPVTDEWIELMVPASAVGLEGKTIDGWAYTLYGGSVIWDASGVADSNGGSNDNNNGGNGGGSAGYESGLEVTLRTWDMQYTATGPYADNLNEFKESFANEKVLARGVLPNINYGPTNGDPLTGRPDQYSLEYEGYIYIPASGTYTFAIDGDDADALLIDGNLVAYWFGGHAFEHGWSHNGQITLSSGYHRISVYMQEYKGADGVKVAWKMPGSSEYEIIPAQYFYHETSDNNGGENNNGGSNNNNGGSNGGNNGGNGYVIVNDDFSSDSGKWVYYGSAYRDRSNGYVVLTKPQNGEVGVIWLNQEITSDMTVEFDYYAGGGTGADGFVMMFYKDRSYTPGGGGSLGFGKDIPGYGIEFDSYKNPFDASAKHIALIENSYTNHLKYVNTGVTDDGKWHHVKVVIGDNSIDVYVDNTLMLSWSGNIDRSYGGFGFAGATGGLNDWHIIDNVKITVGTNGENNNGGSNNNNGGSNGGNDNFRDNFDNGMSGEWSIKRGTWKVESGVLDERADEYGGLIVTDNKDDRDVTIEVDARTASTDTPWLNFFICFGDVDDNHVYVAGARDGGNAWVIAQESIEKSAGSGGEHIYKMKAETINSEQWYHLKVVINGNTVTLYVDGIEKVSYTFSNGVPVGYIGLYGDNNHAQFDNFEITYGDNNGVGTSSTVGSTGLGDSDFETNDDMWDIVTKGGAKAPQVHLFYSGDAYSGSHCLKIVNALGDMGTPRAAYIKQTITIKNTASYLSFYVKYWRDYWGPHMGVELLDSNGHILKKTDLWKGGQITSSNGKWVQEKMDISEYRGETLTIVIYLEDLSTQWAGNCDHGGWMEIDSISIV